MIGKRVLCEGVRRMECCLNWDGWDLWGMDVPSAEVDVFLSEGGCLDVEGGFMALEGGQQAVLELGQSGGHRR